MKTIEIQLTDMPISVNIYYEVGARYIANPKTPRLYLMLQTLVTPNMGAWIEIVRICSAVL